MKLKLALFIFSLIFSKESFAKADSGDELLERLIPFYEESFQYVKTITSRVINDECFDSLPTISPQINPKSYYNQPKLGFVKRSVWELALWNRFFFPSDNSFVKGMLRDAEKIFIEKYPIEGEIAYKLAFLAREESIRFFKRDSNFGEDLGNQDAFRHVYWVALMTKYLGEDFSLLFSTAHEVENENFETLEIDYTDNDRLMDFLNNEIGRIFGNVYKDKSDDEISFLVLDSLKNGELFVLDNSNPKVPRKRREIIQSRFFYN